DWRSAFSRSLPGCGPRCPALAAGRAGPRIRGARSGKGHSDVVSVHRAARGNALPYLHPTTPPRPPGYPSADAVSDRDTRDTVQAPEATESEEQRSGTATDSEQHGGVPAHLPETDLPVGLQCRVVVGVHIHTRGTLQLRHQPARHTGGSCAPVTIAATIRTYRPPLDLSHSGGPRPDFGLEHDLTVFETRERTTTGYQLGYAGPVVRATIAEPRVHPDFLDEHRHRSGEIAVQISHGHLPNPTVGGH